MSSLPAYMKSWEYLYNHGYNRDTCNHCGTHSRRQATIGDLRRIGITEDLCVKRWNPDRTPIVVAGSVMDANSICDWIMSWTKIYVDDNMYDMTAINDLTYCILALDYYDHMTSLRLSSCITSEQVDVVEDFVESRDRLWARLLDIIDICTGVMLRELRKLRSSKERDSRYNRNGAIFVSNIMFNDTISHNIFKLYNAVRIWSYRYCVNCN